MKPCAAIQLVCCLICCDLNKTLHHFLRCLAGTQHRFHLLTSNWNCLPEVALCSIARAEAAGLEKVCGRCLSLKHKQIIQGSPGVFELHVKQKFVAHSSCHFMLRKALIMVSFQCYPRSPSESPTYLTLRLSSFCCKSRMVNSERHGLFFSFLSFSLLYAHLYRAILLHQWAAGRGSMGVGRQVKSIPKAAKGID